MLRNLLRDLLRNSLRCPLLALALLVLVILVPGTLHAMQDAASTAAAQPCSDHEASFPSCGISDANRQKADALFRQAVKLARHGQFEQALDKLKAARAISPLDTVYSTAEQG